jgi:hypothetical protein
MKTSENMVTAPLAGSVGGKAVARFNALKTCIEERGEVFSQTHSPDQI